MAKRKLDFTVRDYWNQDSLLLYKEAVSRYPYCAPARLSFLLNLKALNDPDYERELAFTALAVPDRQRLQAEVQAVEQAAAAWRERGDRRMRQAARWAAASATTAAAAAVGRLMSVDRPANALVDDTFGAGQVAPVTGGMTGREVSFKAVVENVLDRSERTDEPSRPVDTGTALGYEAVSSAEVSAVADGGVEAALETATWTDDDWADRSRSARRNARRRARRNMMVASAMQGEVTGAARDTGLPASETGIPAVHPVAEAPVAFSVESDAPAATISMLWAAAPEETAVEVSASATVAFPASATSAEPEKAPARPARRRPEVFNPWAEVFTPQHTISDWLQADDAEDTSASGNLPATVGEEASVAAASSVFHPLRGRKKVQAGNNAGKTAGKTVKSAAKATRSQSAAAGKAARTKTVRNATAAPAVRPAATPVSRTAPDYVDPNELIDRFLRQNDDHILIQVDETRDYNTFDPDNGSLREDWSMGSETLAQLYLKQGSPDKAIEIYRYLSLKFPEKSRYFASLIRAAGDRKRG